MIDHKSWSIIQKQRSVKHHKLIYYIESFKRSKQQVKKLQKIKAHTLMQINLRFLKSDHNKNYKFPYNADHSSSSQNQCPEEKSQSVYYDLRSQNDKRKTIIVKVMPFESDRKTKSLDRQKNSLEKDRITRLNIKNKHLSLKKLRKEVTIEKNHRSNIKLPVIHTKGENCQTEPRTNTEISQIIGKKIATQISAVESKFKGVQKYVKETKYNFQRLKKKSQNINTKYLY